VVVRALSVVSAVHSLVLLVLATPFFDTARTYNLRVFCLGVFCCRFVESEPLFTLKVRLKPLCSISLNVLEIRQIQQVVGLFESYALFSNYLPRMNCWTVGGSLLEDIHEISKKVKLYL
jgi:hypothetical protein